MQQIVLKMKGGVVAIMWLSFTGSLSRNYTGFMTFAVLIRTATTYNNFREESRFVTLCWAHILVLDKVNNNGSEGSIFLGFVLKNSKGKRTIHNPPHSLLLSLLPQLHQLDKFDRYSGWLAGHLICSSNDFLEGLRWFVLAILKWISMKTGKSYKGRGAKHYKENCHNSIFWGY